MANEVTIVARGRDQDATRVLNNTGDSLKRIGEVAGGILTADLIRNIGEQAQRFLGDAARAASGLEQAVGGTEAVFGDARDAIDDFGRTSAQSVGLSEREFREATTLIGGQLKRMTGDVGVAADASLQLVQVGADLAATYGGTTKEAVDAFAAALRGEADPAERFNLNLKVSAVNAKAVELGLAATTNAVDDNARAQALLALVMEQSADAQGQFAREADTAAVAQQKATAAWEDAQAQLGQALLPAMAGTAEAASTLLGWLTELPDATQATIGVMAALGAGLLILAPRIVATRVALQQMGLSMRTVATRGGGALAAITALATAAAFLEGRMERAEKPVTDLTEDLVRFGATGRATGEATDLLTQSSEEFRRTLRNAEIDAKGFFDKLDEGSDFWLNTQNNTHEARKALERYDAALVEAVKAGADHEAILDRLIEKYQLNSDEVAVLLSLLPEYQRETQRAAERSRDLGGAQDEAAAAAEAAAEEFAESTRQMADTWREAVGEIADANQALEDANAELREDQELTTQAFLDAFAERVEAAANLNKNLVEIQRRASADVRDQMLEDARENPRLAQLMVDATAEEWQRMEGLYRDATEAANRAANLALVSNIPSLRRIAEESGTEVAEGLAAKIREGRPLTIREVQRIMSRAKSVVEGTELLAVIEASLDERTRRAAERQLEFLARDRTAHLNVHITQTGGVNAPQVFAHGGIVGGSAQAGGPRGGLVQVNEEGLELGRMPSGEVRELRFGTTVIPAGQSEAMLHQLSAGRAGAGVVVNLYVQGSIRSDKEIVELIRDELLNGGFRGVLETVS